MHASKRSACDSFATAQRVRYGIPLEEELHDDMPAHYGFTFGTSNMQRIGRSIRALPIVMLLATTCATAQCLDYDPEVVTLSGVLTSEEHPGPPNFASIGNGDQPETIWVIDLDAPVCVRGSVEPDSPENDVEHVQFLQSQDQYGRNQRHLGRRVAITGRLVHATTAEHRKAVLIDVDEFRSAAGVQEPNPAIDALARQVLLEHAPGFRLATHSDFVEELRENRYMTSATQSVLAADFNQDGANDLAIIAISEARPEYRIYYAVAGPDGFRLDLLQSRELEAASPDGLIRNSMFLKEIGEGGVANRSYANIAGNPLDPENFTPEFGRERAAQTRYYESVPAIEVWTGPARVDAVDERNFPDSGIMYCSTTWYYGPGGELETFGACD